MIKGTNRRMFRRPRPAREASGILASSQELINQVLPLRMENGGDPFAELRKLIEAQSAQTKEPGFRELIRSLGVGALQSEFADPSRGTVENFARALPFALESVDKKRDEARAQALALAQARSKLGAEERNLESQQQLMLQRDIQIKNALINNTFGSGTVDYLRGKGVTFSVNPKTGSPVAQIGGKTASNTAGLLEILPSNVRQELEFTTGPRAQEERTRVRFADQTKPTIDRIRAGLEIIKESSGGDNTLAVTSRTNLLPVIRGFSAYQGEFLGNSLPLLDETGKTAVTTSLNTFLKKSGISQTTPKSTDRVLAFIEGTGEDRKILFMDGDTGRRFGRFIGEITVKDFEKLDTDKQNSLVQAFGLKL